MKHISTTIAAFSAKDIAKIEKNKQYVLEEGVTITLEDVEINSADIPGFSVTTSNGITVALDINICAKLKNEGIAREFVNRIQKLRKENGFEVTDKIKLLVEKNDLITESIKNNFAYICEETLATNLNYNETSINNGIELDLLDYSIKVSLIKI